MWELARRSPVGLARSGIHTLWPNFAIGAMFSELRAEGVLRSSWSGCLKPSSASLRRNGAPPILAVGG